MWSMSYLHVKLWIERMVPFQRRNPEPKCPSKVRNDGLTRPNGKIGEVPFREKQGKTRISVGGYECNLKPFSWLWVARVARVATRVLAHAWGEWRMASDDVPNIWNFGANLILSTHSTKHLDILEHRIPVWQHVLYPPVIRAEGSRNQERTPAPDDYSSARKLPSTVLQFFVE
jgi:hypothetical protein